MYFKLSTFDTIQLFNNKCSLKIRFSSVSFNHPVYIGIDRICFSARILNNPAVQWPVPELTRLVQIGEIFMFSLFLF